MSFIRKWINQRNLEFWRDEVFIAFHWDSKEVATIKAKSVCQEEEIEKLLRRIIKIEKKIKKSKAK